MLKRAVLVLLAALLIFVIPVGAQEDVIDLDEVVVTASRYEEAIMDTPVSIEVISQEDIAQSNSQNVADLLNTYTGVSITDFGGPAGAKQVNIRGASASQVLILLDGQPINEPQNGGFDLGLIPTNNIERIEVIKGPASVIYGANAMGGVVNIITKDIEVEPQTRVSLNYGSYNNFTYELSHSQRFDDLGVYLSYLNRDSDGLEDGEKLEQETVFARLNYQLSNHSDLTFTFEDNTSDKIIGGSVQDDHFQNLNLKWNTQKENRDTSVSVFRNYQERLYPSDGSKHERYQTGLNINNTNYFDNHILNYGFEIKEDDVESTDIIGGQQKNTNKALYIQDDWGINDQLNLKIGARYDDHEEYGSELSPQIGANYKLSDNYSLVASAAQAFRAPTFDDLYGTYPPNPDWFFPGFEGNPDLKAETSDNYEIGLRFNFQNTSGQLSLFQRKVDNLITSFEDNGINTRINIEGTSEFKGIELGLDRKLAENINTKLNYTYLDARDQNDNRLANQPYHNAKLSLNYNDQVNRISLDGRLVAGRLDMPSYFVLDSRFSRPLEIRERDFNMTFSINNLLDRDYQVVSPLDMPGRNFMLSLGTSF
ncbi:TonB-dependent receptor plug domain-containing protein [Halanaerobium hydrogeniformans]|uniref:TonB-dependent receptor n=1 Tax=Halanaerobium hydrogeniformans TaxID=656519 RepID=E4RL20_HALHG|nr:TonB-dependent receptor [Halanaerobium hydrogeniformans]ADQ14784.1 TonB-dependent receptor [Halanaerobium hydrogeniformans]